MSGRPALPSGPALERPASVRIVVSDGVVRRFAALTGDVSSLHMDDAFARRSAYRRTVVHGMLPLAFLPLLAPLRVSGHVCRIRSVSGRFQGAVFAGDALVLSADPGRASGNGAELEIDYRIVREATGVVATAGTLRVSYAPAAAIARREASTDSSGRGASLLTASANLASYLFEEIEKGMEEEPLAFRTTAAVLAELGALRRLGADVAHEVDSFDDATLLGLLLFSTSVGVRLPGSSATFLDFTAEVQEPLSEDVEYRLISRVTHRSKATKIVKKQIAIAPAGGGKPLVTAKVGALVNEPGRAMPTVEELRAHAGDLGLAGKVALVTGASRGLGETIAKLLSVSGARVVVNYHRGEHDANRVVEEIEAAGGEAIAIGADVSSADEVRALVAGAVQRFGTVDVLVNNAARDFRPIPFSELTWDDVQKDLDVIVKGALLCCREVVPLMLERGSGRIVNVGSLATEVPPPDQLKYVMAKSALVGLTRGLALELAPRNVQVNIVVPSFVETDLVAHVQEGFRRRIADETPMRRLSTPIEVAQAVVFLASSYASFTTGQKLMVTGGAAPLL